MRYSRVVILCVFVFHLLTRSAVSQPDASRAGSAISCASCSHEKVAMRSTDRLPGANGTVNLERRGGMTEIDVELDSMKPAALFGGDYNTYVLWVVPPSGAAENAGEIALEGDRSRLHTATAAETFAVLVTAEPHYLASVPSAFVVLENKRNPHSREIRYPVLEGVYNFQRASLDDVKEAKGKVHSEVKQAFTAMRLAQRAGAVTLAHDEFAAAQRALERMVNLWHQQKERTEIAAQARETVRLAVAAQHLARDRAFQETRVEGEGSGGGNGGAGRRDRRGLKVTTGGEGS